jgi:hypothetical protein
MTIIQDSLSNYVQIIPKTVNSFTNSTATRLYVYLIYDNLKDNATFTCSFTDDDKNELFNTQVTIQGQDYINWSGDNTTPFSFVINNLNIACQ